MTEGEAQHSRWTFYEVVKAFLIIIQPINQKVKNIIYVL